MDQKLIQKMVEMEDLAVPTLFKPVQFNILKKLNTGKKLSENEKRYLRGKMKDKLNLLSKLEEKAGVNTGYIAFLNSLGSYYITGLEALKHNGYGWYFDAKVIEVINTRIEGKLAIAGKMLKLIRVKSITNSKYAVDKETGLSYADNEQVFKDTRITKNTYTISVWKQLLSRYNKIFIAKYRKYKNLLEKQMAIDYSKYGV
mgnify:CR=1 FL=1